jgi:hypothetical protein
MNHDHHMMGHDHHNMMDHSEHHAEPESTPKEYAKFACIILGIILVSYYATAAWSTLDWGHFLRIFMGVFFLVFGLFKLLDLRGFATSYMGYDVLAKRSLGYAYAYPFIELALAAGYFLNVPYVEWIALFFMAVGSIGVFKELMRHSNIKCACLGTYVKLPLTTVSLVEDLVMGLMALLMILKIV